MKRMTFTSSVPSHVYDGHHLLERMCRLRLINAQWCSINEKDGFRLWCPVMCTPVFIYLNGCVTFASSVPGNNMFNYVYKGWVGGIIMI
jgi:hypothetical protein